MNVSFFTQFFYMVTFVLFFFFGIVQTIQKQKTTKNYYLAGALISTGYQYFYQWLEYTGIINTFQFLGFTDVCVTFLIGPLAYGYFCTLAGIGKMNKKIIAFHTIPFFLCAFLLYLFRALDPEILHYHGKIKIFFLAGTHNYFYGIIWTLSYFSISAYLTASSIKTIILFKGKKVSRNLRKLIIVMVLPSVISIFLVITPFYFNYLLFTISFFGFSIILLTLMIFTLRDPNFETNIMKEIKLIAQERQGEKNYTQWMNINQKLLDSMSKDKLYRKENLTIYILSAHLKIKNYELSAILNTLHKKNFNSFINDFRVEEAKALLSRDRKMSVTEIAFAVGFNSRSAFYSYFLKIVKKTPGEYRKEHFLPSR